MEVKQLDLATLANPRPILKWAGGKQQLLGELQMRAPKKYRRYIEPFFGGGALFFALKPKEAIIADSNPELINLYRVIADDVEQVIALLREMQNDDETFYAIRATDARTLSPAAQAARTIYLNRTCFNGLYRVNRQGQFNVPFGSYKNPTICDEENLRAASFALRQAHIVLGDYKDVLREHANPGDFVYLDPPYLPISKYSDFKRYTKEQFYKQDHHALAQEVNQLHELGCHVLMTNSNHPIVRELFGQHQIDVLQTRRNINKDPSKRRGEDVVISIPPKRRLAILTPAPKLADQVGRYPSTRFMGSKQELLEQIWAVASQFEFASVLDLFSGSGVVSYMFKAQGKRVFSNDYMSFCATFAKALVENNSTVLTEEDVEILCDRRSPTDGFVSKTFAGLYYGEDDNLFIDIVRANLPRLRTKAKRSLAMMALIRACLKKRPRGIFTFVGHRYDDGRRDLKLTLEEQFREAVRQINNAVFDNGQKNQASVGDSMDVRKRADLVYIDPPYFSPLSDNEYVRRYHFVEGLARDWQGVDIQWHTKTRKFRSYPTPFGTREGAKEAFETLFHCYQRSVLIISYSSNSQPSMDEMLGILSRHKKHVEVVTVSHRYSFGNQGHKAGNANNVVDEYLFVGY